METQTDFGKLEVGTKEDEKKKLTPKKVKIVGWERVIVEKAHNEKFQFTVKHPDREEPIVISTVSFIEGKAVTTSGTWVSLDSEGKLQKGSAIAKLLVKLDAKNLDDTTGKELDTELDDKGYLCFRLY